MKKEDRARKARYTKTARPGSPKNRLGEQGRAVASVDETLSAEPKAAEITPAHNTQLQQICFAGFLERAAKLRWHDATGSLQGFADLIQNNPNIPEVKNLRAFLVCTDGLERMVYTEASSNILKHPESQTVKPVAAWLNGWFECLMGRTLADAVEEMESLAYWADKFESVREIVVVCKMCVREYTALQNVILRVNEF